MKKIGYFKQLSLAARWFLPHKEAVVILEDYQDMLSEMDDGKAKEKFGSPIHAVLAVANRREITGWHLLVAAAAVLLFFFVHWAAHAAFYPVAALSLSALLIGALFLWFGCDVRVNPFHGLPRPLLVLLILAAGYIAALGGGLIFFLPRLLISPCMFNEGVLLVSALRMSIVVFAILGMLGLILARMIDRRWRALIVLSLAAICMSINFLSILYNMNPTFSPADHLFANCQECLFVAAAGILTAGVSLC